MDRQRQRLLTALKSHPPRMLRTLSRQLGRNDAYLHQYLYRGSPRRLPEDIRYRLASLLQIPEEGLRDSTVSPAPPHAHVRVPFLDIQVSAGHGSFVTDDEQRGGWLFDRAILRQIHSGPPENLRLLSIRGDSMEPVLNDGDCIMVNTADIQPSPPGIFILHDGIGIMAKRLEIVPQGEPALIRISSANPQYSAYQRPINDITILGRVVWFGRALSHR